MQTFLPYPDFTESARCLDDRRLGKQRIECMQIYRCLTIHSYGWKGHPAVEMWRGHLRPLALYWLTVIQEWEDRGFRNNIAVPFPDLSESYKELIMPPWLGREDFHASHRSNLLRKNPVWYGQFGWSESPDLPYIWPVRCS
jgi:Pyrimidine dimer DNA glycosylase